MATTRTIIIERAKTLLRELRADSAIPARNGDLEELLLQQCRILAFRAITEESIRSQLTKTVQLILDSNGEYALTGAQLAATLPEALKTASLYIGDPDDTEDPADYYADQRDYRAGTPHPDVPRWTIINGKIQVKTVDGIAAGEAITMEEVIFVPYVDEPTNAATTLPVGLEDELVKQIALAQKARHEAPPNAGAGS